eukprot:scaffold1109_cov146-Skeletonema_marinoi.AAC.8
MNLLTNKSCKLAGSLLLPSQILYTAESQVTRHGQTAYKFPAAVPLFTLAFILSFPSTHRLNQNVYEMLSGEMRDDKNKKTKETFPIVLRNCLRNPPGIVCKIILSFFGRAQLYIDKQKLL